MKIFEHITNDKFFNPLIGDYRQLNSEGMDALMKASAENAHLQELTAREMIEEVLEDYDDDETVKRNRGQIYDRLRDCGWLDDSITGRDGRPEVILNEDAMALMLFLHQRATGEGGLRASDVHGIYDAAQRLTSSTARPYQDGLLDIQDRIRSLSYALINLRSSIRKTTAEYLRQHSTAEIMEFFRDKDVEDLFREYHYIREGGFATQFFSAAKAQLDEFEFDEQRLNMAVREICDLTDVDEAEARERLEVLIRNIRHFLQDDYRTLTDDIDREINACNDAITTELILSVRYVGNSLDYLVELIDLLKRADVQDARECLQGIAEMLPLTSVEYIGRASLEPKRRPPRAGATAFVEESSLSDEELAEISKEMAEIKDSKLKRVKDFVEEGLSGKKRFVPGKASVKEWNDALIVAELLASAGEGTELFPYDIELTGEYVETDAAGFTGISVRRRNA